MSKLLSELVDTLELEVPAVDGVPSAGQYENCVKDAVRDFSERCGTEKIATLSVVSGTATYTLPADFLEMIVLEGWSNQGGVMITSAGIIPLDASFEERYTLRNGQITFFPTPSYTMARDYRYKAGWALTVSEDEYSGDEYADMGEREARIVMIKAKQLAMDKINRSQASAGGGKYSLGAVSVDNSTNISEQSKSMFALQGEYVSACEKYNGARMAA
jgi:hypothetical protein